MMGNTLSRLIFVQARERFQSEIRVISGLLPKHFQKQRQRSGTMLRRSIVRCYCRSEEHTSELQSLMRISYAVFCLKTKNKIYTLVHRINVSSSISTRIEYEP